MGSRLGRDLGDSDGLLFSSAVNGRSTRRPAACIVPE
jgi:hypothetical protein